MKALASLDPLLEHRIRLGACVLLAKHGEVTFARLKAQLQATDGNLGAQLRKLEQQGYLAARKDFVERKPTTWYQLTPVGRAALEGHMAALQSLIDASGAGG
ncbi:winged helix-turn-helix domain-containing protein [Microbulbifer hydrolyticus]|uniref:Transcriptional regulator n=1 Tax=Microbulbifer hydrolyticus TaxID=48074 RepID=A0A6P1T763_9GAMM|nr:transcriptional regulator [Microbulbifer hydrolyticus]MBB5211624.1 DNA-binding MarR family transcriptional regulator [Microbulbifer hydrolyticus]QHQ37641.1 transcriptional regulator [Microbulbifer hydrolyticus]